MAPVLNPVPEPTHVLLVEDEVLIRTTIAQILRDAGFLVIEAANADEAWSYLQTGAPVDLVFSDIQMPGSMDGVKLARKVRENYDHIVIVLTSGRGAPPSDNREHFISKPFRPANVVAMVTSLLEQK
jgi:CheY-like chemotaxis protein